MEPNNLGLAEAYLDYLWSRRNLYFVEVLMAKDCKLRDSLFGESTASEHVKAQVCEMHQGFPDIAYTLDGVIVNAGNQLALRWSAHGTHRGQLLGIPATRRAISLSGMLLLRFAEARMIAITSLWDPYCMFHQLGLVAAAHDVGALARSVASGVRITTANGHEQLVAGLLQERMSPTRPLVVDVDAQWDG